MRTYNQCCDRMKRGADRGKTTLPAVPHKQCRMPVKDGLRLRPNHASGHSLPACTGHLLQGAPAADKTRLEQLLAGLPEKPIAGLAAASERYIREWGQQDREKRAVEQVIYDACTTDDARELAKRTFFAANLVIRDESAAVCLICTMLDNAVRKAHKYADDRRGGAV